MEARGTGTGGEGQMAVANGGGDSMIRQRNRYKSWRYITMIARRRNRNDFGGSVCDTRRVEGLQSGEEKAEPPTRRARAGDEDGPRCSPRPGPVGPSRHHPRLQGSYMYMDYRNLI